MIFTQPMHEANDCHNPTGPGGGRFCGDGAATPPKLASPMGDRLRAAWPETTDPFLTGFLLRDGTRIEKPLEITHAQMADGPRGAVVHKFGDDQLANLYKALDEGVIRYVPKEGVYLTQPPSALQARVIVEDWESYFPNALLRIDYSAPGARGMRGVHYKAFEPGTATSDAVRNWVKRAQSDR